MPDRYRVGVPLAFWWGSNDETNRLVDYQQTDSIYFLGGTPQVQLEAAKNLRPDSLDGSSVGKAAQFGDIWVQPEAPQYEQTEDDICPDFGDAAANLVTASGCRASSASSHR